MKMGGHLGVRAGDVVAFGHTHKPWHRSIEGIHFVNTGSVGRPKDGDWRAGYATVRLADEPAGDVVVEHIRVEYDLDRAAAGIRESTLPDAFATILETGGTLPDEADG